MALLSIMKNYGSTSSTSTTAALAAASPTVCSLAASFEAVLADAMPPSPQPSSSESEGPAAIPPAEDKMMMKKKTHQSNDDSHQHHHHRRGGKRSKTGFMIIPAVYSFLLVSVVMAITLSALIQPTHANPTCILNCAQCVKIYGDFFDGHSCAKVCMESRSKFDSFVDCADPTTIARFLKSF